VPGIAKGPPKGNAAAHRHAPTARDPRTRRKFCKANPSNKTKTHCLPDSTSIGQAQINAEKRRKRRAPCGVPSRMDLHGMGVGARKALL